MRLGTKSTRKGENGSEEEVVVEINECYIYFSNAKKKEKKETRFSNAAQVSIVLPVLYLGYLGP